MPQNPSGRWNTTNPIYGDMQFFQVGDLDNTNAPRIVGLAATAVAATSAALNVGANGCRVLATFSTNVTVCDIVVYRVDNGVDTPIATFLGVKFDNADSLYISGFDNAELNGKPVKVRAQNIQGGGTVALDVRALN
jgi:hypothetical protein